MRSPPLAASESPGSPIDLRLVRKFFASPSRSAESDFLRREVANRMNERLALMKIEPRRLLDAGCGEGSDLLMLQDRFVDAHIVGVDASARMLAAASDKQLAALSSLNRILKKIVPGRAGAALGTKTSLICADFAHLPLGHNAVDLLWSNLALHWHPQPALVFAEWKRILRVDGLLMFSCFGPDTFRELRTAFAAADDAPHVLPFVDMHDFGDMLVDTGFSTPVMDMEIITVTYECTSKLLADVRAWGGNPLMSKRRGLFGKSAWQRVIRTLDQLRRPDGKIPLSFEIIYGHAFRPIPTVTADGEKIIRLDFPASKGPGDRGKKRR